MSNLPDWRNNQCLIDSPNNRTAGGRFYLRKPGLLIKMPKYIRRGEQNVRAAVLWYDDARKKNNGVEKIIGVWRQNGKIHVEPLFWSSQHRSSTSDNAFRKIVQGEYNAGF